MRILWGSPRRKPPGSLEAVPRGSQGEDQRKTHLRMYHSVSLRITAYQPHLGDNLGDILGDTPGEPPGAAWWTPTDPTGEPPRGPPRRHPGARSGRLFVILFSVQFGCSFRDDLEPRNHRWGRPPELYAKQTTKQSPKLGPGVSPGVSPGRSPWGSPGMSPWLSPVGSPGVFLGSPSPLLYSGVPRVVQHVENPQIFQNEC